MIISEVCVIGSCLCEPQAVALALTALTPEHFADQRNEILFGIFKELKAENIAIDHVIVWESMTPQQQNLVSLAYLLEVVEKVPTALHMPHYIALVKRDYFARELQKQYTAAAGSPLDPDARDAIKKLWENFLESKSRIIDLDEGLFKYQELLEERAKGNIESILSGYPSIDFMTGGFHPGQLVTIAARTSRGKTTFLLCLADRFMMRNRRVLYFSAEMGFFELVDRIMAARTRIPLQRIRGRITTADMTKLMVGLGEIHKKPLAVDDVARLSLESIRAGIERQKPDIVFVDYIQRFQPPSGVNRAAFFSDVANELKAIAREKGVVMFLASQINREVEKSDREPNLADLKESGGIEEASDIVVALHSDSPEVDGQQIFDFIFLKQRNGPLGRARMVFMKPTVSFEELEPELENGRSS